MYKVAFLLSLCFYVALAKHEKYDGYVVYEVKAHNEQQAQQINALENQLGLDIWSYVAPSRSGYVLVPGMLRQSFEKKVSDIGAQFEIEMENVKEALEMEEQLLAASAQRSNSTDGRLSLDVIHRHAAINAYLDDLGSRYSTVTVVNGGKSFEGRDIKYLKVSTTNFQDNKKPVIMIQSMLHAREWVTLPAALYAIEKLVIDITDRDLVDNIDWIIVPIANPDGYEFSHTNTRFWRKNRSTGHMIANLCQGVDLNRNFNFNWGTMSSSNVCAETFHGPRAASEPETVVLLNIIYEHSNRLEMYLDIHSFGSLILYGYGDGSLPANALALNVACVRMAVAIDAVKWTSKPNYRCGNIASTLYQVSGGASDYVQGIGVPFSFTYELPAYRNSNTINGFLVEPEFVRQAGYETWEGIKAGARFVLQNNRMNKH